MRKGARATTDRQILLLLRARDERAAEALQRKYGKTCMRVARSQLHSREDAEECVNEVWLQIWQADPPPEPDNLEALLVTVTQRTARRYLERARAQKRGGGAEPVALDAVSPLLHSPERVEDTVETGMMTAAVERFLDQLPKEARVIFVERYRNDTEPREIAEIFHLSRLHVRKSLMQTRKKLRQFLKEEGYL